MDKQKFKKLLKPLVKECIHEALLEGGILSGIISEVVTGMSRTPLLNESPRTPVVENDETAHEERVNQKRILMEESRQSRIKKLNESFEGKLNGVNPFEGSTPTSMNERNDSYGTPDTMAGIDPSDPGVDISALQALMGANWNKHGKKR
jgi:hypothetical protein